MFVFVPDQVYRRQGPKGQVCKRGQKIHGGRCVSGFVFARFIWFQSWFPHRVCLLSCREPVERAGTKACTDREDAQFHPHPAGPADQLVSDLPSQVSPGVPHTALKHDSNLPAGRRGADHLTLVSCNKTAVMTNTDPVRIVSSLLFLQREVGGPGTEEWDHVSAADHSVPDEEERNGLSTPPCHQWVVCFSPCSIIQSLCGDQSEFVRCCRPDSRLCGCCFQIVCKIETHPSFYCSYWRMRRTLSVFDLHCYCTSSMFEGAWYVW